MYLMQNTTIAARYVTSAKYDTLFLISGESPPAPLTLANLYCGRVSAVNGALDIYGSSE